MNPMDPIQAARLAMQGHLSQQGQAALQNATADHDFVAREQARYERGLQRLLDTVWKAGSEEAKQLNLPPLLEKRRLEHLIPNGAFASFPLYDRIFIYQIAEKDNLQPFETYGDTNIVKPGQAQKRDREANPRGILVGAGLLAMDQLLSNGVELGHIVRFQRFTPYCHEIDNIEGQPFYVQSMLAGHVVSSEDLEQERRAGIKAISLDLTDGRHEWVNDTGASQRPKRPQRGVDE